MKTQPTRTKPRRGTHASAKTTTKKVAVTASTSSPPFSPFSPSSLTSSIVAANEPSTHHTRGSPSDSREDPPVAPMANSDHDSKVTPGIYDEDFDGRFQKTMVGALTRIVRGAGGKAEFDYIVAGIKPIYGRLRKPDGARYKGNLHKAVFGALHATGVFSLQEGTSIWALSESELVNYKWSLFRRQNQAKMRRKKRNEQHKEGKKRGTKRSTTSKESRKRTNTAASGGSSVRQKVESKPRLPAPTPIHAIPLPLQPALSSGGSAASQGRAKLIRRLQTWLDAYRNPSQGPSPYLTAAQIETWPNLDDQTLWQQLGGDKVAFLLQVFHYFEDLIVKGRHQEIAESIRDQDPSDASLRKLAVLPSMATGISSLPIKDAHASSDLEDAVTRPPRSRSGEASAAETMNTSSSSQEVTRRSSTESSGSVRRERKDTLDSIATTLGSSPLATQAQRCSPSARRMSKEASILTTPNSAIRHDLDGLRADAARLQTPFTPSTPFTRDNDSNTSFGQGRSTILSSTGSSRDSRKSDSTGHTPSQFLGSEDPGWGDATSFLPVPYDRTSFSSGRHILLGSPNNLFPYSGAPGYYPGDQRPVEHMAPLGKKAEASSVEEQRGEYMPAASSPLRAGRGSTASKPAE